MENIKLTGEELEAIRMVIVKKNQAQSFLDRVEFPKEMEQNIIAAFYKAAGDSLVEAKYAESQWWKTISNKYGISDASLDVETGEVHLNEKR